MRVILIASSELATTLESQMKVQLVIKNTAITNLNCRTIVVPFLVPSPTFTWDSVKNFKALSLETMSCYVLQFILHFHRTLLLSRSYGSTILAAASAGHYVLYFCNATKKETGAFSRRLSRTVWTLCASSLTSVFLHPKSFDILGKGEKLL